MNPTGTSRAFEEAIGLLEEPEPSSLAQPRGTAPQATVAPIIVKKRRLPVFTERFYPIAIRSKEMRLLRDCFVIVALGAGIAACGGTTAADSSAGNAQDGGACTLLDELKLSPRDDGEAEQLALEAAATLAAPTDVYTRMHADLMTIRAQFPEVSSIHARPSWALGELDMSVDDRGFAAMSDGTYTAWTCLNARYGMSDWMSGGPSAVADHFVIVRFGARRLNVPLVAEAYASLPNLTRPPGPGVLVGDASDVCASYDGDTYSYVFKLGDGDCPSGCTVVTYWGFSTRGDGSVTLLGKLAPDATGMPAWLVALGACRK